MLEIDYEAVGKRIARFRKLNGQTAAELAAAVGHGLTRETLAKIETGRRATLDVGMTMAIAWALGVPPVALLWSMTTPDETSAKILRWFDAETLDGRTPAGMRASLSVMATRNLVHAQSRLESLQRESGSGGPLGRSPEEHAALIRETEAAIRVAAATAQLSGESSDG